MSAFEKVPQVFKPVDDALFQETYIADQKRIQNHIGGVFDSQHFSGPTLSHAELATWIGSYAMEHISNTSYRNWIEDPGKLWAEEFQLLVWRLVHVIPLGHAYSDMSYKATGNRSFNPTVQSITDFNNNGMLKRSNSNRHIDGNSIALALYQKIFGTYTNMESGLITFAVLDCFSNTPNTDNPFYVAIRNAIRSTLVRTPYPVPYFWRSFLVSFLSQSEGDLLELNNAMKTRQEQSSKFDLAATLKAANSDSASLTSVTHVNDEHSALNTQLNEAELTSHKNQPPEPHITTQEVVHKAEAKHKKLPEIETLLIELGDFISEGVRTEKYKLNQTGALIHRVNGILSFVYPNVMHGAFKEFITAVGYTKNDNQNEIDILVQEIELRLLDKEILRVVPARLNLPNKTIDIELAQIHPNAEEYFVPFANSIQNNPIISIG